MSGSFYPLLLVLFVQRALLAQLHCPAAAWKQRLRRAFDTKSPLSHRGMERANGIERKFSLVHSMHFIAQSGGLRATNNGLIGRVGLGILRLWVRAGKRCRDQHAAQFRRELLQFSRRLFV